MKGPRYDPNFVECVRVNDNDDDEFRLVRAANFSFPRDARMSSKASETKLKSGIILEDGGLKFDDELWSFAAKLGSGRFASVFRIHCTSAPERMPLAAKVTQLNGISQWARAQLSEELAIWQTLKHPNVVRMYGHMADATRHVLVLELALGGELFERIVKMQSFCEAHAARQIAQVLSAVEYLHSFGVLHRDLKPENLLLESDADDAAVKVADFGASKLVISSGGAKVRELPGHSAPPMCAPAAPSIDPPPLCVCACSGCADAVRLPRLRGARAAQGA